MKNVLADEDLLPSPPPLVHPPTTLNPIQKPIGVVCRSAGKGEGGRAGTGAELVFPLYSFLFCHL